MHKIHKYNLPILILCVFMFNIYKHKGYIEYFYKYKTNINVSHIKIYFKNYFS